MNRFLVVATLVLATASVAAPAQQPTDRSARDGIYTSEQADRGQIVYEGKCELCHGSMRSVTPDMAPLLNDYAFQTTWTDRSVGEFFEITRDTMPQDEPGTLSDEELVDIIAYVLSANRMPPGEEPLPSDTEVLNEIRLGVARP